VFRNLAAGRRGAPTAAETALSDLMSSYWTNFAKTGDPNGPGLPAWPAFTAHDARVMYFDGKSEAVPLPNATQLGALDQYFAAARAPRRTAR
jgi:para-nitrobenzyl esterase